MHRRLRPASFITVGVLAALYLPSMPAMAPVAFLPLGLALLVFVLTTVVAVPRARRPEVVMIASLVATQALLATSIVLNDQHHAGGLAILAWPVVGVAAGFVPRVAAAFTGYTAGVLLVASLSSGAGEVLAEPATLAAPLGVVVSVAVLVSALLRSDIDHRDAAVVDGLTGTLNRTALAARTAGLEALPAAAGEPVAVIVGDIDHFKRVNDTGGHAVGDAVLREIGVRLRDVLRAGDRCYRLGGEEFAILAAGVGLDEALDVAERLRAAVSASPVAGVAVTMSFGVAAMPEGEPFVWSALYRTADAGLYAAKLSGRDRVVAEPLRLVA